MVSIEELKKFRLLEERNDRELEQMAKLAKVDTREAGARIIAEDALSTNLYLVQEGKVVVKTKSPKGEEMVLDEVGPGMTFGWGALLDQKTRWAAAYAEEPTRLIVFYGDHVRQLMEANNHIGYRLMKGISRVLVRRLIRMRSKYVGTPSPV